MSTETSDRQYVENIDGIQIIKRDKESWEILGVSFNGGVTVWRLGQRVHANGRIFVPKGTLGIITMIHQPFSDRGREGPHTNNILKVYFEGQTNALDMKPKDLEPYPHRPELTIRAE